MKWSQSTETGLIREINEDSIGVVPERSFFAVADGMGGHLAGEVASRIAVETIARCISTEEQAEIGDKLMKGARLANSKIFSASKSNPKYRGMGTTITAAVIDGNELVLVHVGDSRAYIIRGEDIITVTEDHSLVQELYRNGGITREQAREHPRRNVLTRALGTEAEVNVDLIRFALQKGDTILLCSDGLSGLVEDKRISAIVRAADNPEQAVRDLVAEALERGGTDNISVIVVDTNE